MAPPYQAFGGDLQFHKIKVYIPPDGHTQVLLSVVQPVIATKVTAIRFHFRPDEAISMGYGQREAHSEHYGSDHNFLGHRVQWLQGIQCINDNGCRSPWVGRTQGGASSI